MGTATLSDRGCLLLAVGGHRGSSAFIGHKTLKRGCSQQGDQLVDK